MRSRSLPSLLCSFMLLAAPLASAPTSANPGSADGPVTGTVATERGLHTASFDTLYGTVTVNLPDDLSAGDSISGTVETAPAGTKNDEVAKNQGELSGVVVEIGDSKTPAKEQTARVKVPDNAPDKIPVVVRTREGTEMARAFIPVRPKPLVPDCLQPGSQPALEAPITNAPKGAKGPGPVESSGPNTIRGSLTHASAAPSGGGTPCPVDVPTFSQPGRTVEIKGPFDGESGTTIVKIGGQATRVLAESPRKVVVKAPEDSSGPSQVEVFKKGTLLASTPIRSIAIRLWAGKLNLVSGETTKFTATVEGLDGLDVPVSVRIDNNSPAVVSMQGGNHQSFTIAPGQVNAGQFVIARVLTGILPGGFKIIGFVDAKSPAPVPLAKEQAMPRAGSSTAPGRPGLSQGAAQQPRPGVSLQTPSLPGNLRPTSTSLTPQPCNGTFDDFESGVLAWQTVGTPFVNQPVEGDLNIADARPPGFHPESVRAIGGAYWNAPFPNGHQGQYWIWSKLAGDAATGGMISPEFTVATRFVHFLAAGGVDPALSASLQIESHPDDQFVSESESSTRPSVLPSDLPRREGSASEAGAVGQAEITWHTLHSTRGQGTDMMRRVVFEIPARYMGRRARFRVDDGSVTSHIAVDDFQCSNERPAIEPDRIWGIADTHIHQFTNVGFGGQFIRGFTFDHSASRRCDSNNLADLEETAPCAMARALRRCDLSPDGRSRGHGPGGALDLLGEMFHGTMGYPTFDGWPKWSSLDHQRVYADWLKRAHDAGLQLIVIQLTSNETICDSSPHDYPTCRDMYSVDLQIAEAHAFERYIEANDGGWYKIVTSPREARQAIANDQLAAVLGIEVDTLFDCPSLDSDPRSQKFARDAADVPARKADRSQALLAAGLDPDDASSNWFFEPNRPVPALGLPARLGCTPEQVTERLRHYVNDLGVRHFYPVHVFDNQFAGAAIYNEFFQVANLTVNGSYFELEQDPEQCAIDIAYSFRIDSISLPTRIALQALKGYDFGSVPNPNGRHCNARGLSPLGEHLIREMIRMKVFFDVDHMSEKAFWQSVDIANRAPGGPYPLISGHAGFRQLGYSIDEAVSQQSDRGEAVGMVRHESMKSRAMVDAIFQSGGILGPIIEPGNNKRFDSPANAVVNDCPGSSKSWAQYYLYAVDLMHGRGVGWGSEMMGLTKLPNPRFGSEACKGVEQSDALLLGFGPWQTFNRAALAARQENRVFYRAPRVARCDDSAFGRDRLGFLQQGLCKARTVAGSTWDEINQQCLANVSPCAATPGNVFGDSCLRDNVCRGVRRGMDPTIDCDDRVWEIGTGGRNRTGACRAQQGLPCTTGDLEVDSVCEEVRAEMQNQLRPTALEPVIAGSKVFDINTDGFAQIGMVPDFLSDLENVGVTKPQFEPLFRSAEDFIEAWERIEGTRPRGPWSRD